MEISKIKKLIKERLEQVFQTDIVINEPKETELGDLSVVLFNLAKTLNIKLPDLAAKITNSLSDLTFIKDHALMGGFYNIYLDRILIMDKVLSNILSEGENYPVFPKLSKTIAIDYSSPNIAKSFSIGHLRSTIIGNSLIKIANKLGYNTVGINYLGDWGTQFGKMIVAYNNWLDKKALEENPILELTRLYVLFHEKAKEDASLEDLAREAFLKCEQGNEEYLALWKKIRELSLEESKQIYDLLDIKFDSYKGEAFYNNLMQPVIDDLIEKQLLVKDDGAMVVKLDDMPPALIQRSDGGTLYITRDITAFLERYNEYHFEQMLYVVGNEQKLHFEQLKAVLNKMQHEKANSIKHVNFGLYLTNGKKMSTRSGGVVKLYDVLNNAIEMAKDEIIKKNPNLEDKEEIAKRVGISAILFNDLKNSRELNIEFDLNKAVTFEGNTGPYLLYSIVRIKSILRKAGSFQYTSLSNSKSCAYELFSKEVYYNIIKLLDSFDTVIEKAFEEYEPSVISKYLLLLAQAFNTFYGSVRIIDEDNLSSSVNYTLINSIRIVLEEGLRLLGIKTVDKM